MSTNGQRLLSVQTKLEESGVKDVKFFFAAASDTPPSVVARDAATVLEAVINGKFKAMPSFNDSTHSAA